MYSVATNTVNAQTAQISKEMVDKAAEDPSAESDAELSTATSTTTADKPESTMSRSEIIRARLRDKEKRLSTLVRASSTKDGGGFLSQYAQVEDNLKKVADEKSELEKELEKLRKSTSGDKFLKEKMAGIQDGFDKQVEKIQELQDEVNERDLSITMLREELVRKLRRIIELEFDLETHTVHYTNYAAEQFKLGEDALNEITRGNNMTQVGEESMSSVGTMGSQLSKKSKKSLTPRRAQKLISKLLADLDDLEARYKDDSLSTGIRLEQLIMRNEELLTKVQMLETRLEEEEEEVSRSEPGSSAPSLDDSLALRKRADTYEARCAVLESKLAEAHVELKESSIAFEASLRQSQIEVDSLTSQNLSLRNPSDDQPTVVQSKIKDAYREVSKLEAEAEIKDRKLAKLKKEITKLRLQGVRKGDNAKESGHSALDTELVRESKIANSAQSHETGSKDDAYVTQLKNRLQDTQQALVKKDQELVIERAKAASTAAGLLARINELTKVAQNQDQALSVSSRVSERQISCDASQASGDGDVRETGLSRKKSKRAVKGKKMRFLF